MHQLRRRSEFTSAFGGIAGVTGLAGGPPLSRMTRNGHQVTPLQFALSPITILETSRWSSAALNLKDSMVFSAAPANRVASLLLALDQIDGQTSPDVIAGTDRNGFDEAAGTLTSD
jgi:hypothetical protein